MLIAKKKNKINKISQMAAEKKKKALSCSPALTLNYNGTFWVSHLYEKQNIWTMKNNNAMVKQS